MKAKLTINGKEIEVEISDGLALEITKEQLKKLVAKQPKKIGYERAKVDGSYYYIDNVGDVMSADTDIDCGLDRLLYDNANYYSDETIAENNARADKLMRQLRRFAVEHRNKEPNWLDNQTEKHMLLYNYENKSFYLGNTPGKINNWNITRVFGAIYFDSKETAELAVKTFRDELTWYFTEYKDSL